MAAAAASGLAAKRIGIGPAAASPSKECVWRNQVAHSIAGRLSLNKEQINVRNKQSVEGPLVEIIAYCLMLFILEDMTPVTCWNGSQLLNFKYSL